MNIDPNILAAIIREEAQTLGINGMGCAMLAEEIVARLKREKAAQPTPAGSPDCGGDALARAQVIATTGKSQ